MTDYTIPIIIYRDAVCRCDSVEQHRPSGGRETINYVAIHWWQQSQKWSGVFTWNGPDWFSLKMPNHPPNGRPVFFGHHRAGGKGHNNDDVWLCHCSSDCRTYTCRLLMLLESTYNIEWDPPKTNIVAIHRHGRDPMAFRWQLQNISIEDLRWWQRRGGGNGVLFQTWFYVVQD